MGLRRDSNIHAGLLFQKLHMLPDVKLVTRIVALLILSKGNMQHRTPLQHPKSIYYMSL